MTLTLVVLVVYLIFMFIVGIYGRKYAGTMGDFLTAARQGTLIMVAASYTASHVGNGFVVGGAENGANYGIGGVWWGVAMAFSYFLFATIAKKMYRGGYITLSDYFYERYGDNIPKVIFAVVNVFASIGIIGGQILAGIKLFEAMGLNGMLGGIIVTLIVIIYSSISGLWGVLMTDLVQMSFVIFALVATFIAMLSSGALETISSALPATYYTAMPFELPMFITIVVPTTLYGLISQAAYQRTASAKNESVAVWSPIISGIVLLFLCIVPVLIGMYGKALYPELSGAVIFFKVLLENFSPIIGALLITGVLAAVMSTCDGLLLAVTAHVAYDLYGKIINPNASEKSLSRMSVVVTFVAGIIALIIAISSSSIVGLLSFTYTILVGASFVTMVGGLLWKNGNSKGALASSIVGVLFVLLNRWGILPLYHSILAVIPSAVAYVIVSLATGGNNYQKQSDSEVGV
jgi:SSS family solute:Na+ symporter